MGCDEVKEFLDEYICGELDSKQSEDVRLHLDTCNECREEYEKLRAFKYDLKELAQPLPSGFNDSLKYRLRRSKRLALVNRISVGMAAAVVLVCVIGIGYEGIFDVGIEDKLSVAGTFETTTDVIEEQQSDSVNTTNKVEPATESTDIENEGNKYTGEAETIPAEVEKKEDTPETVTEGIIPRSVTLEESTTDRVTESEYEVATSPLIQGRSVVPYNSDEAEESGSDIAEDTEVSSPDNIPAVASLENSDQIQPYSEADVYLVISDVELDALVDVLSGSEYIRDIEVQDNIITLNVDGISYTEFKGLLSGITVVEENGDIAEDSLDYSIEIEVK